MPVVSQRKEAARILGITARVLGDWAKEAWFPADARTAAGWDTDKIAEAREVQHRKGSVPAEAAKRLKLATDHEKLKQAELQTKRKQIELAVEEGELVPRRAVELHFATLLTELGDKCEQLPELIAGDVPAKLRPKLKARLREELERWRRELAAELKRQAQELDSRKEAAAN